MTEQAEQRLERAVAAAELALIEFEIAVETFRVEVENFSRLHHQKLGPMYARIDELDALIAEAVAGASGAPEDIRLAREARARAQPMPDVDELFALLPGAPGSDGPAERPASLPAPEDPRRVRPSKEVQQLYRELARKAHPDLASDPAEQKRRSAFFSRVNQAYADCDAGWLRELAAQWAAGPPEADSAAGEQQPGCGGRLAELCARLDWLSARQKTLAALRTELETSAIGAMLRLAPDDPDALLNEIAEQLLAQVAEREAHLAKLTRCAADGHSATI